MNALNQGVFFGFMKSKNLLKNSTIKGIKAR